MLIIKFLDSSRVPLLETIQHKRRFLVAGLITLSTLAWCWTTSTSYDIRLLLRGNRYMDLLEYERAISIYNQAINEFPSNVEYKKSIQLDGHLTVAYGNIGLVFLKQGNVEESIPFLRKVFPSEEEMLKYILTLYSPNHGKNG